MRARNSVKQDEERIRNPSQQDAQSESTIRWWRTASPMLNAESRSLRDMHRVPPNEECPSGQAAGLSHGSDASREVALSGHTANVRDAKHGWRRAGMPGPRTDSGTSPAVAPFLP